MVPVSKNWGYYTYQSRGRAMTIKEALADIFSREQCLTSGDEELLIEELELRGYIIVHENAINDSMADSERSR